MVKELTTEMHDFVQDLFKNDIRQQLQALADRLDNLDSHESPICHHSENSAIMDTLTEQQGIYNLLEKRFNKFQETFLQRIREIQKNLTSLENGQKMFEEFEDDFHHGELCKESIRATLLDLLQDQNLYLEAQPNAIVHGTMHAKEFGNSPELSQVTAKLDAIQREFNSKIVECDNKCQTRARTLGMNIHQLVHSVQQLTLLSFDFDKWPSGAF